MRHFPPMLLGSCGFVLRLKPKSQGSSIGSRTAAAAAVPLA